MRGPRRALADELDLLLNPDRDLTRINRTIPAATCRGMEELTQTRGRRFIGMNIIGVGRYLGFVNLRSRWTSISISYYYLGSTTSTG